MSDYTSIRDVGPAYLSGAIVGLAAGSVSGYDPIGAALVCSAATGELSLAKNIYLEENASVEDESYESLLEE